MCTEGPLVCRAGGEVCPMDLRLECLLKNDMGLRSAHPWAWMVALLGVDGSPVHSVRLPGPGMIGSDP